MSISAPFIRLPIGTSLLAAALLLSGILAFNFLPVASLPRVDFPVIGVGAALPGADPQTMASAVATPLERQFGRISGVNPMTSTSQLGTTSIVLQFDLKRNIDAAGRDRVRNALNDANASRAKGQVSDATNSWTLSANDQLFTADQYRSLIVAYSHGAPVRLGDVGEVLDSVSDTRNIGLANGKPSVLIIVFRQPGANIIQTVDRVLGMMPFLQSSISPAIDLTIAMDRTVTVRASVKDIEFTLILSIILVILVVFAFLRTVRATIIPSIAVPLSLVGTFGVMYLLGYSLDNLSLMALAISTGFVVDDAIVVLENITRYGGCWRTSQSRYW